MADLDSLFLDKRSIDTMPFGAETSEAERDGVVARVRGILKAYGCVVADDINRLGCTGVVAGADGDSDPRETARFLRLGLAGGGVGLPCFVPPTRFCLVHETIGGLQENQKQLHPEFVDAVSRPLTEIERGMFEVVNAARTVARTDPDAAADLLSGRTEAPGVIERGEDDGLDNEDVRILQGARLGVQTWKCGEHTTTNWACRYCVAQAIVEGPLSVTCFVAKLGGEGAWEPRVSGADVPTRIAELETAGSDRVEIYVLASTFTRKLSRD